MCTKLNKLSAEEIRRKIIECKIKCSFMVNIVHIKFSVKLS
jgi:hypothetical protein